MGSRLVGQDWLLEFFDLVFEFVDVFFDDDFGYVWNDFLSDFVDFVVGQQFDDLVGNLVDLFFVEFQFIGYIVFFGIVFWVVGFGCYYWNGCCVSELLFGFGFGFFEILEQFGCFERFVQVFVGVIFFG